MSDGFAYRIDGGRIDKAEPYKALDDPAELVWIHLSPNDEGVDDFLRGPAGLADPVVDALTATETRPRCDQFGDGALLNLRGRAAEPPEGGDVLSSVRVWAMRGRVFSVTRNRLIALDAVKACVEQSRIHDPGDLIAEIAAAITADLDPEVAELGDELDVCEESLDAARIFDLRRQVSKVRRQAIGYRRFLSPQRDALEKLAQLPGDWIAEDDRVHLAAAADRAARMAEELEAMRERAALVADALTDIRAEQLDQRGLVISIAALVFLPLTFLTGLYGMNVEGLPFAQQPWAFAAIAAVCVAVGVGVVLYFARARWFSG